MGSGRRKKVVEPRNLCRRSPIVPMMRSYPCSIPCLVLLACTPETDLRQDQTAASTETTSGSLSSPEPDPLAGQLVDPPTGSIGIATNLAALVVRFTEAVQPVDLAPPFLLRSAAGDELPLPLGEAVPCPQTCYQIALAVELGPSLLYALETMAGGLQFLDGKPVPAGSAGSSSPIFLFMRSSSSCILRSNTSSSRSGGTICFFTAPLARAFSVAVFDCSSSSTPSS